MSDAYDTAFKLLTLGYSVIPSGGGDKGKAPLVNWRDFQDNPPDESQLQGWQDQLQPHLWGIVTNERIAVIDADTAETRAELEAELGAPHVVTPRGGAHWYLDTAGHPMKTVVRVLPDVDVRGVGGFVNVIGTRLGYVDEGVEYPTADYIIKKLPVPGDTLIPWDKLPKRILAALNGSKPTPKTEQGTPISQGQRNAHLAIIAGAMRRRGADQEAIEAALLGINARQCQPPLTEDEVRAIAASVSRYEPKPDTTHFNLTDLGNAERLVKQYGNILRYCYERDRWLIWNGNVWEWDNGAKIKLLAKLTVRSIYNEAANDPDEKARKAIADHARHSESDHRLTAMINLAQSEPGIPVKVAAIDTNPWLFNCLNGTLDLRTGQLLPHCKEDLLTVIVPMEYQTNAQCPRWLSFLDRVTGGKTELACYLQRAVGYSLTGSTKSQVLFFLYGLGNNGKSTFVITIRKLVGEYGDRANTDLFMIMDRNAGGPKEGLANLKGKRYVVASELEDGRRLAVGLIKDMTGGETIKADRKYEHEVEYQPTHKLWLVGNHKPVITDTTLSIWRRVKLIPFTVTIPENEVDPDLPSKLEAELPGILTWAVKGCLDWQRNGLKDPDDVTTATAGYRKEQDILGDFIEDCCVLKRQASIPKADLKAEYETWCKDNNIDPVSQRTFKARLIEKGITEGKSGSIRHWKGITLRSLVPNGTKDAPDLDTNGTTGTEKPGNPLYKKKQEDFTENPVQDVPLSQNDSILDYPTDPCLVCGGGDYWLREASQWGKAEWLCSHCHPKSGDPETCDG